jgi:hypothetical protein
MRHKSRASTPADDHPPYAHGPGENTCFAGIQVNAADDHFRGEMHMGHADANTTAPDDRRGEYAMHHPVRPLHVPYRRRSRR